MTLLLITDPVLEKIQKHFESLGLKSSIVDEKLDFEIDYKDVHFMDGKNGIGTAGSLKLENSPIDYLHIIKKQEYAKCDFAVGGHVGMGVHIHSWYKMRFFLSFPESIKLGPFDMGTLTTIKKGLLHSEVESFVWNGYQKLTTLPPGLVRDNVADALYSDKKLKKLMMKCLLKERTITVSRYSPMIHVEVTAKPTSSKIKIESTWKLQKDMFINKDTLDMYEILAGIVKSTINTLKYHLK
ncbi:MAG: hypothetical protein OEM28_09005 [Nitrosopumilus sp.]|nr:hypothetical protein [Nitrosopumilus sp.]MDH3488252.1 hypothetical protein [Nitrosopumilus sp.]